MNYEKEYKKLKADIEKAYLFAQTDSTKAALEHILPELRESEDERIRKYLIYCVNRTTSEADAFNEISKEQILAWLEKQGTSYTKRDVDDAYVEGMTFAKNELEKQKPTWSEEDEEIVTGIINDIQERLEDYPIEQLADIYFKEIKWLKSLKNRIKEE